VHELDSLVKDILKSGFGISSNLLASSW